MVTHGVNIFTHFNFQHLPALKILTKLTAAAIGISSLSALYILVDYHSQLQLFAMNLNIVYH
jgi:hypothetical protein